MHDRILQDAINKLERISRRDPGERGLAAHAETGMLYPAARELHSSERVLIVTGFCIRSALIGETDGPPGALALANALRQLGKAVAFVTDRFSRSLLEAGAELYGGAFPMTELSQTQTTADTQIAELLEISGGAELAPHRTSTGNRNSDHPSLVAISKIGTDQIILLPANGILRVEGQEGVSRFQRESILGVEEVDGAVGEVLAGLFDELGHVMSPCWWCTIKIRL